MQRVKRLRQSVAEALHRANSVAFTTVLLAKQRRFERHYVNQGQPTPAPDMLNAGIARAVGGELIAIDEHFAQIPDLDCYNPRSV